MIEKLIKIKINHLSLEGMLSIPKEAKGMVLFAHGSGSSRLSPRNNFVAQILQKGNLGTLLIDLLSEQEDATYETRFDIDLLTKRLIEIVRFLRNASETKHLQMGLFGASTGAAAALKVAAALGKEIKAVVSRGGRPDLALDVLDKVTAPTLLIVGGEDFGVIELNQKAYNALHCTKKLEIVPRATHLFEEPGCLDEVAKLAKAWFNTYLSVHKRDNKSTQYNEPF